MEGLVWSIRVNSVYARTFPSISIIEAVKALGSRVGQEKIALLWKDQTHDEDIEMVLIDLLLFQGPYSLNQGEVHFYALPRIH